MKWKVDFTTKAKKQYFRLPSSIKTIADLLLTELEIYGPIRGNWKNYGKLSNKKHHCHLKTGKPTYVMCWETYNKKIKVIEVYYVGTHEKAPYS